MMPEENKVKKEVSSVLYKIKDTVLNFLVPLIAILGSLLLGILYILPSFKSLSTKRSELESKIALKNTLDDKVSYLKKLVDLKETLDENSEIVNKVLVSEPEVPRLLDQATQIAEKAGMSLDRLSYSYSSKDESETEMDTVTVSMDVNSSFEQLILFMELVEKSARFVSIPNFRYTFSERTDEENTGAVSSTFSLDSPYLFVQSSAVTDDPIKIDVTSVEFINFMEMLKNLDYYDFVNQNIQAEEKKPEETEEEGAPVNEAENNTNIETPAAPVTPVAPAENTAPIPEPETPETPAENTTPVPETPVTPEETDGGSIFPTQ